jgi:hypothetical protein
LFIQETDNYIVFFIVQKSAGGKQTNEQKQMEDGDEEGEVPMEEEQEHEEEPNDGELHLEDIAQPEQEHEEQEYSKKCQRRLESNLHKYHMVRAKKWMRRIDQSEIGRIIAELEIKNVANLMSMADTDIGLFEET